MRFFKTFLFASAVFILGGQSACGGSGETVQDGLTPEQLRKKWTSEHEGQKTGQAATFDITGSPLVLTTSGTTELTAPLTLSVGPLFPDNKHYVFFEDAQVGAQKGLLVLEGTRLSLTAGQLGRVALREALARTHLKDGSAAPAVLLALPQEPDVTDPKVTFPEEWSKAESSLFFSDPVAVRPSGVTLTGFTRGLLVTGSGNTAISGSVTVTSAARMYWDDASRFEAQASLVDCPRFALGGAPQGGELSVAGTSTPPPGAFMGEGARVRLEPGRARSEAAFQLTQAMAESGPRVPAEIEVAFDAKPLTVKTGARALVTVIYREKSLRGDAVLADIQVTGSGKDAVTVAVDQPDTLLQHLWTTMEKVTKETGPVSPIFTAPIIIVSPFIAIGEALSCLFQTCPEPYSSWANAGKVSRFHILVTGKLPAGTYSADVTLTGRNYPAFTIPVQFTIPN